MGLGTHTTLYPAPRVGSELNTTGDHGEGRRPGGASTLGGRRGGARGGRAVRVGRVREGPRAAGAGTALTGCVVRVPLVPLPGKELTQLRLTQDRLQGVRG